MSVKLLRKVEKAILKEPKRFCMGTWGDLAQRDAPVCGTVGCIAGWAALLNVTENPDEFRKHVDMMTQKNGKRALKLTLPQCRRLFFLSGWPSKFQTLFLRGDSVKAAVKRIEHFIKTGGRE
jgi:hypothetical protein